MNVFRYIILTCCAALDISPLLGCMAMGTVYINMTGDERLFRQLNYFSPPILLLFFVRSGISFDLGALLDNSEAIGAVPLSDWTVQRLDERALKAFAK